MTLLPGARIGAYTITELVGSGGMGEVYKARDTRLNRTVAIKLIRQDLLGTAEHAQRFPALRHRVRMMSVAGEEKASFRAPATRAQVRREVESILGDAAR